MGKESAAGAPEETSPSVIAVKNPSESNHVDHPAILEKLDTSDRNKKVISLLLSNETWSPDASANTGDTLRADFKAQCYSALGEAVSIPGANFDPSNDDDVTLFRIACAVQHRNAMEIFLRRGFDPNVPFDADQLPADLNPVSLAIARRDSESFAALLERIGVDFSRRNSEGSTPLHQIYYAGLPNHGISWISRALNKINSDGQKLSNSTDKHGVSHFHLCCMVMDERNFFIVRDFVRAFIDDGDADANRPVSSTCPLNPGFTPLHFAVQGGCFLIIEFLFARGARPDTPDDGGKTPLSLACENFANATGPMTISYPKGRAWLVIQQLVRFGADPLVPDASGGTLVHEYFYRLRRTGDFSNFFKSLTLSDRNSVDNHTDDRGLSLFHVACTLADGKLFENLLDSGVDVDARVTSGIYRGYAPLHFAVAYNRSRTVEILLKRNAKVDVTEDVEGLTPLHMASNIKSLDIVRMLLDHGACPLIADKRCRTPLHEAFYGLCPNEFKFFDAFMSRVISSRSNDCTDAHGLSLFHMTCATSNADQVVKFLDSGVDIDGCRPHSGRYEGFSGLHFAVLHNQKEVVKILLERNAQVNVKGGRLETTPLCLVCEFNFDKFDLGKKSLRNALSDEQDIIKMLLSYGADVDKKIFSVLIQTSMAVAELSSKSGFELNCLPDPSDGGGGRITGDRLNSKLNERLNAILRILMSHKVDVDARTGRNQSSILKIVRFLLKDRIAEKLIENLAVSGADVNGIVDNGSTLLHEATSFSKNKLVRTLLKHNANPDIKNENSETPLEIVTNKIHYLDKNIVNVEDIFFALVKSGSDINVRNLYGKTILHNAIKSHNVFLTENLLKYGADINMEQSFSYFTDSSLSVESNHRVDFWMVVKIILFHVKRLEALRLPVSKKVRKLYSQLYLPYKKKSEKSIRGVFSSPDEIYVQYEAEASATMSVKIGDTSLYEILRKDPYELTKYVENKNLIDIVGDENLRKKFPFYSHLLEWKFRRAERLKDVTNVC